MLQRKVDDRERRARELLEREWKAVVVLVWLLICAWFLFTNWNDVR